MDALHCRRAQDSDETLLPLISDEYCDLMQPQHNGENPHQTIVMLLQCRHIVRDIKINIVGAGFGGLTAAIECQRQSHDVEVYESIPELKSRCEIISFGADRGLIFYRWGKYPSEVAGPQHRPERVWLSYT